MIKGNSNSIVFDAKQYDVEEEMWGDVAETLRILTKNGEVCSFQYEDCGIYVLQHNADNWELSGAELRWVPEDKLDLLDYEDDEQEE